MKSHIVAKQEVVSKPPHFRSFVYIPEIHPLLASRIGCQCPGAVRRKLNLVDCSAGTHRELAYELAGAYFVMPQGVIIAPANQKRACVRTQSQNGIVFAVRLP